MDTLVTGWMRTATADRATVWISPDWNPDADELSELVGYVLALAWQAFSEGDFEAAYGFLAIIDRATAGISRENRHNATEDWESLAKVP